MVGATGRRVRVTGSGSSSVRLRRRVTACLRAVVQSRVKALLVVVWHQRWLVLLWLLQTRLVKRLLGAAVVGRLLGAAVVSRLLSAAVVGQLQRQGSAVPALRLLGWRRSTRSSLRRQRRGRAPRERRLLGLPGTAVAGQLRQGGLRQQWGSAGSSPRLQGQRWWPTKPSLLRQRREGILRERELLGPPRIAVAGRLRQGALRQRWGSAGPSLRLQGQRRRSTRPSLLR